jgi:hypothetical protein
VISDMPPSLSSAKARLRGTKPAHRRRQTITAGRFRAAAVFQL